MIHFVNSVDADKLRMAYNNDVFRFLSTLVGTPKYAEVTLNTTATPDKPEVIIFSIRLYANPDGEFYINLQPYIAAIINTRNFEDTLITSTIAGNPDSFLYAFATGTTLSATLHISITHGDTTVESSTFSLTWLTGVQQQQNYYSIDNGDFLLLSVPKEGSLIEWPLKYWQGYPFDISFYKPMTLDTEITIVNETNRISQTFNQKALVNRLIFCDGQTDETLDSVLPLTEGINKLKFDIPNPKWVTLEKLPYRCGVYLKWLNTFGGYSYWLFEDTYPIDRTSKELGEIDVDNANLENTNGRTTSLGRETRDSIKIITELLTHDERGIVEGILESPKIYMFIGKPYSKNSHLDWIEVSLKTTSTRIKNSKQALTNFAFDIMLPQRFSQRL